jgi:tetratricopeptide (TPR) repeat protein
MIGCACSPIARSAEAETLFREATSAYSAGDYETAARSFRQSAAGGPASGTLLNLGLAEWQKGNVGAAIQAWEQSLWLNPYNPSARINLRFARKAAQVEAPELSWNEVVSTWLPVNWWAWLAGLSLWLAVGMTTIPAVLRLPKAAWHQALAAFGIMVFLLSVPAHVGVHTRSKLGFILDKEVSLRLTPTAEAQTITRLGSGEPIRKLRVRGDFILVRTSRATGWVGRSQFGLICPVDGKI